MQTRTGADGPDAAELHRRTLGRVRPRRLARRPQPGPRRRDRARRRCRPAADVDAAVTAARQAFPAGARRRPSSARGRCSRSRQLLEEHFEELARIVTTEHGKTLDEVARQRAPRHRVRRGRLRRAVAADGLRPREHRHEHRLPRSSASRSASCAAIAPFNFPAMVPLWFLPFAVVSGNTFIVKPSEQVPLSQRRMFELLEQCDLPPGVVNLVNGGREVVEAICDHPGIRAVSFVGSTPVARAVYQRAHARRQARAGARRRQELHRRDARRRSRSQRSPIITESFYGCAGERCLAGSVLVPVGEAHQAARDRLVDSARGAEGRRRHWSRASTMGPVISAHAPRARCSATSRRASPRARSWSLDGRELEVADRPDGLLRRARRSSTTCRRRWRSAARRSSGRWRRSAR